VSGRNGRASGFATGAPPDVARLASDGLTLAYDGEPVVVDLSLVIPDGKISAIVGPNACGKSTLLRGLARLLKPRRGAVYLDGRQISSYPTREVALRLGLLPQSPSAPDGLTVEDLVGRGRYPHQGWLRQWSAQDEQAVERALALTHLTELRRRPVDELSGGQRQRAWVALAVAQEAELMLLDEPTTFLDMAHEIEVLDLLHDLNRVSGRTVVLVIHDLNLAARYADQLIVMSKGRIKAQGPPSEVISEQLLRDVFGVECRVMRDPVVGTALVIPISRAERHGAAASLARGHPVGNQSDPEDASDKEEVLA
jgi:iron complex transport system ATP-binding protein